jgi:hypothetical protein
LYNARIIIDPIMMASIATTSPLAVLTINSGPVAVGDGVSMDAVGVGVGIGVDGGVSVRVGTGVGDAVGVGLGVGEGVGDKVGVGVGGTETVIIVPVEGEEIPPILSVTVAVIKYEPAEADE